MTEGVFEDRQRGRRTKASKDGEIISHTIVIIQNAVSKNASTFVHNGGHVVMTLAMETMYSYCTWLISMTTTPTAYAVCVETSYTYQYSLINR